MKTVGEAAPKLRGVPSSDVAIAKPLLVDPWNALVKAQGEFRRLYGIYDATYESGRGFDGDGGPFRHYRNPDQQAKRATPREHGPLQLIYVVTTLAP